MNKTKIIIFVTAGLWQLPGIKEAKKLGLKILGIDHDKNAIGLKHCDFKIVNDLDKHKLIINKGKNPITNAKIIQDCNWAAKASTKCVKIKEVFKESPITTIKGFVNKNNTSLR